MESFTKNNIYIDFGANNDSLLFIYNDRAYQYNLDPNYKLKLNNEDSFFEKTLVSQILNSKKISNKNHLLTELFNTITNLKFHCIGCYKNLDYKPDIFTTCGNQVCYYKTEELVLDDYVCDYIKENFEVFKLLVKITSDSIQSTRCLDVFDPYPNYFLDPNYKKEMIQEKRGAMIKLQLDKGEFEKYNKAKNMIKLNQIVSKTSFDNNLNIDEIKKFTNDKLIALSDNDYYQFLRFVVKSCNLNFVKEESNDKITIYKITHPYYVENEFNNLIVSTNNNYSYLFHGSAKDCWHSILRNGIKIFSNTSLQFNGAAYGPGIYMSDNFSFAATYSNRYNVSRIYVPDKVENLFIGVFQVVGQRDDYKKAENIYVVADNKLCLLKYLIQIKSSPGKNIEKDDANWLNDYFQNKLIVKNSIIQTKMKQVGNKKIMTEFNNINKFKLFDVTLVDDNLFNWIVSKDNVKLGIKFPSNYPFDPPFIRVIGPKFTNPKYITNDGAICCEYLTKSNWLPVISIENLIIQIFSLIIQPNLDQIENSKNLVYSYDLAVKSYETLAKGNGWY